MNTLPQITYTPPPVYHRHEWRLSFDNDADEDYRTPNDIIARCEDCPATMTREQVEAILNGAKVLTDE